MYQPLGPLAWVYKVNCFPWDIVCYLWLLYGGFWNELVTFLGACSSFENPGCHLYHSKTHKTCEESWS